jgi:protein-disulfide isomerase
MSHAEPGDHLIPPVEATDHYQGWTEGSVILVEYGDYACPHCVDAHELIRSIQMQFSQVCFVFRHFPCLERHPSAQHAAEAAEAAGAQGKFWEMHDRLFSQRHCFDDASLIEHAVALRLNINRFLQEMSGDVHVPRVRRDYESGEQSGVICTPTFFINGLRFTEDWQQSALKTAIAQLTAQL